MIIQPKEGWQWHFCHDCCSLVLQLDKNFKFKCAIENRQLIPSANAAHPFSLEDTSRYFQLIERLSCLTLSDPELVQMSLNFIANSRFHRPLMPQSWFFNQNIVEYQPDITELVVMHGDFPDAGSSLLHTGQARFLVVETTAHTSTLMLIEPALQLKSGKVLKQFSQIKVMNDRLQPYLDLEQSPECEQAQIA